MIVTETNRSVILLIMLIFEKNIPLMTSSLTIKLVVVLVLMYANYILDSNFMEVYLQVLIIFGQTYTWFYRN